MSKLNRLFIVTFALLSQLGAEVKINYAGNNSASNFDADWVINKVTPYLERISVPQRSSITIEWDNTTTFAGTYVCEGHTMFGNKYGPVNKYDVTDPSNRVLIHEYILARFTPCSTVLSNDFSLPEGFAKAKAAWLYKEMAKDDPSIKPFVNVWMAPVFKSADWLTVGGSSDFWHNPSPGYACAAGPIELLGAVNNGDFRAIDTAITGLTTRDDIINAIDTVSGKVNGVLPSTYLRETKCAFAPSEEMKQKLGFSTDGVSLQTFDSGSSDGENWAVVNSSGFMVNLVERKSNSTTFPKISTVWYRVTDVNRTVIWDKVDDGSSGDVAYPFYPKTNPLPTGGYKRETCVVNNGSCDPSLYDTKYMVVYKEGDWTRNKLILVTNGPEYNSLSTQTRLDLSGASIGKYKVERYPGLFVVNNPVGDVEITDGTKIRVFTSSSNSSVVDFWTQFDDTFVMSAVDPTTLNKVSTISSGSTVSILAKGVTHNDPATYVAPLPTEGCVGSGGKTRVAFVSEFGDKFYAGIQSCASELITVSVPDLPIGQAKLYIELNSAVSNAIDLTVIAPKTPKSSDDGGDGNDVP
ncbi:MAG: hypothetical protein WCK48_02535 [bacterium]